MEHTILSQKTFRYFTHGNPETARKIIFILHVYGQLAEYFIRKFQKVDSEYFIVAPEGMHRFYLNGSSGRVGASWMTKIAREQDIKDNIEWLEKLQNEIYSKYIFDKKIILGFSQGGATAARWNKFGTIEADHLLLWACVYPEDLDLNTDISFNSNSKNHFILGSQDEFFNLDQQKKTIDFYLKKGFNTHTFNGKHTIDEETLNLLLNKINN
jgi:predicted esterase